MSDIEIRQADVEDAVSIAANIKTENTPEQIREQIISFTNKGGYKHLVALSDDTVVGNILIMPTRFFPSGEPHRAELADIVIAPSHRGRGLLGELIEAASCVARKMGITQLETAAWESNQRAVAAYLKEGFVQWGKLENARRNVDGTTDSLICYVREL